MTTTAGFEREAVDALKMGVEHSSRVLFTTALGRPAGFGSFAMPKKHHAHLGLADKGALRQVRVLEADLRRDEFVLGGPTWARPVYGDFQITFLDVLQLTRHHKNIIDNECSAISTLRQATREL